MSTDPGRDPASPDDTEANGVEAAAPDPGSDEELAGAESTPPAADATTLPS